MRDGRQALSLLDATPESFLKNSSSARDDEKRTIETGLSGAMSVADWEKSSLG
jgi:hypothetical protein